MAPKFARALAVYTFIVLMILLRPYLAYQLSLRSGYARDPEKVARLLQRLVKKKETHIDDNDEAAELSMALNDGEVMLPLVFVLFLRRRLSWLLSLLSGNAVAGNRTTVFQVTPANDFYRRISRLQI